MSSNYRIICKETQQSVWIGQGFGGMTTFYSGEPDTMDKLGRFLNETKGKELVVVNTDCEAVKFKEYEYGTINLQEAKRLISQLEFIVRTGLSYHTKETREALQQDARAWLAENTEGGKKV